MIISHKHRYVFLQFPHTACTAVGNELVEFYDGEPFLFKHAAYHDYLRSADEDMRTYYSFSSIRNPLDELISFYFKLKTNHNSDFTREDRKKGNGGWVSPRILKRFHYIMEYRADFFEYLQRFYRLPHVNWSVLDHNRLDFVIRYENLQSDFSQVLANLGLAEIRPIPLVNPTEKPSSDVLEHANLEQQELTRWVAGPLMQYWGYPLPYDSDRPLTKGSLAAFWLATQLKMTYWRHLRHRI